MIELKPFRIGRVNYLYFIGKDNKISYSFNYQQRIVAMKEYGACYNDHYKNIFFDHPEDAIRMVQQYLLLKLNEEQSGKTV